MASFKQTASKCIKDLVNYEKYEKTVKENREILYEAFFEEVGLTTLEEKIGALRFIEGKLKDGTTNKRELRMSGEVFIEEATKPRTRSRKKMSAPND
ncbi:hypothetical protein [Negativicoccus succinicivorans]|uniref:hypothetical protein n=1 Tax=Negativicoccus succinicivorans TaxID=620903 RepID=UPI00290F4F6A|nr:hypothetical protein [Negativicoccus succinicivorans]MDU5530069.1 hypothetical protein [Negativicoccus succinicivorans]MDU5631895.1 hypothetical protein [Enterococcus faecalis]